VGAALLIAAGLKAGLSAAGTVPFNADEAVVGLMARHILQGERPVFFYGQAYLGSLDAWLIAGSFALLGESVLAIRVVQTLLYLGTLFTAYLLALRIYSNGWIARAAALLLAIPTVLVTLYTTATLGGYGEMLLIGNLLLLITLRLSDERWDWRGWLLFGLLSGVGFWGFALVLVYLLPALVYLLAVGRRSFFHWLTFAVSFGVGAAPWLAFTLVNGMATVRELGGAAIAGASPAHPVWAAFQHLYFFLLFGLTVIFGLRPPWMTDRFWLALPLAPFALALYAALVVFLFRARRGEARPGRWLLLGTVLTLLAAFVLTPFGADPSGRYFLPLAVPLALLLAEMLSALRQRQRASNSALGDWFVNGVVLSVVAFNWWGTVQSAADFPPGVTTQFDAAAQVDHRADAELITFLRARGETRGYSNYWVEFPLAFLSGEELIYEARLPYHLDFRYTTRDNRYIPYAQAVSASPRAAYITTRHAPLDEKIRAGLHSLGVTFAEKQIGDFRVFYALSRKVMPEEIGLGVECCVR
jgi:4-amino-4-deoxy-L-arabinose transferase-like glycosyltransferase